jgi:hypothetical protein
MKDSAAIHLNNIYFNILSSKSKLRITGAHQSSAPSGYVAL